MRTGWYFWAIGVLLVTSAVAAEAEHAAAKTPSFNAPLTGGPPAEPLYVGQLRLTRLLEQLTQRTGETLSEQELGSLGVLDTADMSRPILLGASITTNDSWLAFSPKSAPRTDAANAVLAALGLSAVSDTSCAVAHAPAGLVQMCGSPAAIIASRTEILARYAHAAPRGDIDLELGIREPARAKSVYELRSSVPGFVSSLVELMPKLADEPALVHGLSDLAFDWAYGIAETYESTGPLHWTFDFESDGSARTEMSTRPAGGTRLARALASGHGHAPPAAFWQLPESAQVGIYTSTDTWRPFFSPGPRALSLLARVAASPAAAETPALSLAGNVLLRCLSEDRALSFGLEIGVGAAKRARGKSAGTSAKPVAKASKAAKQEPSRDDDPLAATYMMLGIEDARGECGHALQALFQGVAGAPPKAGEKSRFSLSAAKLPADFPKPVSVLSLGEGRAATQLALAARQGTAWLVWGSNLDVLRAPLRAVLHPDARAVERAKARPALAQLVQSAALLGGFLDLPNLGSVAGLGASRDWPLVPLNALERNGELVSTGRLEPGPASALLGQFLAGYQKSDLPSSASAQARASQRKILKMACKLGADDGCNHLGLIFTDGRGIAADFDSARPLFQVACDHDVAVSCGNLGYVEKKAHPEQARAAFEKGCALDSPYSCLGFGTFLLDQGKPGEQALALEKNQKACDGNMAEGCANLGYQYREGKGVSADPEKGFEHDTRACQLGSGIGCTWVGNVLLSGKGHAQDEPLAFKYYARACELDKRIGCYALGLSYLNGRGVDKDASKAREYLRVACDAGHAESCRTLAELVDGAP
jgi:TPR repeat protein